LMAATMLAMINPSDHHLNTDHHHPWWLVRPMVVLHEATAVQWCEVAVDHHFAVAMVMKAISKAISKDRSVARSMTVKAAREWVEEVEVRVFTVAEVVPTDRAEVARWWLVLWVHCQVQWVHRWVAASVVEAVCVVAVVDDTFEVPDKEIVTRITRLAMTIKPADRMQVNHRSRFEKKTKIDEK
jgi:hypothetical protein